MSPEENPNADAVDQAVEKTGAAAGQPGEVTDQAGAPPKKKGGREKKHDKKAAILGAVTDQSGYRKSKLHGKGRYNNFTHLPLTTRSEAERLLEEGATFEEVTEWVNEHHTPDKPEEPQGVTLAAVTDYFRSNFEMQRRRVRYMQKTAQELKKALKGKADSAMAELADAVFITGIMGLSRDTASFSVKDAKRDFLARQAQRDREQLIASQLKTEQLKQDKMRNQVAKLERTLTKGKPGGLSREAMQRIKDIYGLIDQSVIASGARSGEGEPANA